MIGAKGFLVFASLFFYSWWNIAYLPIILSSLLFNYIIGNSLNENFKKVKNVDLWEAYLEAAAAHNVHGTWVRGHNGHPENERCDELARNEAEGIKATL